MTATPSIVLINGLWMTALSWEHWVRLYADKGYQVVARSWPGMEGDIEQLRRNPSAIAKLGLADVARHYEQIICQLDEPPIIIGHGFGGLVTQILLDRGWAVSGVAMESAPARGAFRLPFSTLKALRPALRNPFRQQATTALTPKEFRSAFAQTLSETESLSLYERYVVPAPNRILCQAAFANFGRKAAIAVNFRNNTRAPLLFIAGGDDRVTPTSLVKANFEFYRNSKAQTDFLEFPGRTHFILGQKNWQEVADYALEWALSRTNGKSDLPGTPAQRSNWSVQL
jgi:pimeloyl-ACP methyl ester carboxylesterase